MEILISATQGGFKVLHKTTGAPQGIARDLRKDSGSEYAVGSDAYYISHLNTGVVFSKCRIVRDNLADKRVGNISISVYLPAEQRLQGKEIKSLLDELLNYFCKTHAPDHGLGYIYEDWNFVENNRNKYNPVPVPANEIERYEEGTREAAFMYCSEKEFEKYLDAPYQPEYRSFKRIFFVENKWKENMDNNPLEALRHDPAHDAELKNIDVENPKCTIWIPDKMVKDGMNIDIKANGIKINDGDTIRKKDRLEISYRQLYRETKTAKIKWDDADFGEYVEIQGKKLIVKKITLALEKRIVKIYVKDKNGVTVTDAELEYGGNYAPKNRTVLKHEYLPLEFKGDEIAEKWTISGKKGNMSGSKTIRPDKDTELTLTLKASCIVNIIVTEQNNENLAQNWKIELKAGNAIFDDKGNVKSIEYKGDEIKQHHIITVSNDDYETTSEAFCPEKTNTLYVDLKKRRRFDEEDNESNEKKKFSFSKYRNPIIYGICAVVALLLIGIYFLFIRSDKSTIPDNNPQTTVDRDIREALNTGNINFLRQRTYSPEQEVFKNAINAISPDLESKIGEALRNQEHRELLECMDLNEISLFIVNLQKQFDVEEKVDDLRTEQRETSQQTLTRTEPATISTQTTEITNYLKGNELRMSRLQNYKNAASGDLKTSIEMCIEFRIVLATLTLSTVQDAQHIRGATPFTDFRSAVNGNTHLSSNSFLLQILDSISANSSRFTTKVPQADRTVDIPLSQIINRLIQ